MPSDTGKKARRKFGTRYAAKRAKKGPAMTSTYAAKIQRWSKAKRAHKEDP